MSRRNASPATRRADAPATLHRTAGAVGLVASLLLVALATLTPDGTGWRWGSPLVELRWYLFGLDSPAALLQLLGNLALVALPVLFATRLWPALTAVLRKLVG